MAPVRAGGRWFIGRSTARGAAFLWMLGGGLAVEDARAQETGDPVAESTAAAPAAEAQAPPRRAVEEIVITATKRGPENVQDVPLAVTGFGAEQLEDGNFNDLQSLSYSIPNVQLEDIGTISGYASFSIRGQGINSSIPSVDPTVGVFVDGVYMGQSAGLVLDNFDLEGIEVLRGPQGVLFGRNVTGGAILLRTKKPSDELDVNVRAGVESGLNRIFDGSASGPIVEGLLSAKIAAYQSDEDGWFENLYDGSRFGENHMTVVRPAVRLTPWDGKLDAVLRYEHGQANGDGPATQNHALWKRGTFDFAVNRRGFYDSDWSQVIFDPTLQVPFGDGTITSVFGYRHYDIGTEA